MDRFARIALRLSLAGAGIAVVGAGFAGQASAAEVPDDDQGSRFTDSVEPAEHASDSADLTDASESASPFGEFPGGGTLLPAQTISEPQEALDSDRLVASLAPDAPKAQASDS